MKDRINKLLPFFKNHWLILIIVVLGFIIYSNSFRNSFHFDDHFYITNGKFVQDFSELAKTKYWVDPHFRVIPTLSFAVNYQVGEFNPPGYHLINILLHILASFIVFLLTKQLFSLYKKEEKNHLYIFTLPALIAALFLVHPVQTSSVNYVVQRMTIMSSLFYFLTMYVYIKARLMHNNGKLIPSLLFYLATFVSFYLALFSKQIAATIPLMIFLIEWMFIRKKDGQPARVYLIGFGSILLIGSIFLLLSDYLPKEYDDYTRDVYLASQFEVILRYWRLMIFPYPLNFDPYVEVAESIWSIKSLGLALVHVLILSFAIWFTKKDKLISFGILWFYISLSVESSIIPIRDLMYEHRMYLPSYGFALIFTVFFFDLIKKKYKETTSIFAFSVLILVFSVWSFQRNKVWESDMTLWSDVVENSPSKARAHKYLGVEYLKLGQLEKSLNHLNTAIKKQPKKEWEPYSNRAAVYKLQKRFALAADDMSKCIEMDPDIAWFYRFRAEMLIALQKPEKAISDLNQAIVMDEYDEQARIMRSDYFFSIKDWEMAKYDLDYILLYNENNIQALFRRGKILFNTGEYLEAIDDYNSIIEKRTDLYDIYAFRADSYFRLEKYEISISDYTKSISLNPKFGQAYYRRGLSYFKNQEFEKSIEDIKKARNLGVRIDPKILNEAIINASRN